MGSTWTPAHRTLDPAVPWSAAASPPLHSPLTPFFFCCFFFSFFSFFFFPLSRLLKKWELSEWHSCYYYNYLNSLNFFFKIATWTEESATRLLLLLLCFGRGGTWNEIWWVNFGGTCRPIIDSDPYGIWTVQISGCSNKDRGGGRRQKTFPQMEVKLGKVN